MAKDMDIMNNDNKLSEIANTCVHNWEWASYSICRSLTGCWPSRRVVAPQGAARRVNLSRHSVPDSNTASFDGMQSLKGSYIYCLWHRHWQMATTTHTTSLKGSDRFEDEICRSLTGCWSSREAVAPQGAARRVNLLQPFRLSGDHSSSIAQCVTIEHYLSRYSVPDSNTATFDDKQSLKGSYIYCLWHRHWQMATAPHTTSLKGSDRFEDEICRSLTGCRPSRRVVAPQGAARKVNLSRHSVPDSNTATFDDMQSLKGSYIYCLWHRHWQMATAPHTTSLKGSDRIKLNHSSNI